jgi:aspartate carbamoyltransferase
MKRLGGEVIEINSNESSVKKGETIEDFCRCIECYTDILVLRSPEIASVEKVSNILKIPLINAGDGIGSHPTQALLDVYTIREEIGTVNNLTITIVGDLKNGRTVHSLAKLLSVYNVRLRYVSPKSLRIPKDVFNYVAKKGVEQTEHGSLDKVLETTDILYVTRIQRERFESLEEYNKVKGSYVITPTTLIKAKPNVRILHPLPRVDEISTDLDSDPRAAYFRQMENGLYIRMAILSTILGK